MNSIVKELFRSLEATIHERLSVIENIIRLGDGDVEKPDNLEGKLSVLSDAFESLSTRMSLLEAVRPTPVAETVHVNRIGSGAASEVAPLFINAMRGLEIVMNDSVAVSAVPTVNEMVEVDIEEEVEEEEVEEEVAEDEEEAEEEEEEEVEAEEEEEVEEEEIELSEFTFKNKTFYRDDNNIVYNQEQVEVGRWDTVRNIVLFKRTV